MDRPCFLATGHAKLSFSLASGGEHTVGFPCAGEWLGGRPHSSGKCTLTPLGSVRIILFLAEDFANIIASDANAAAVLLRILEAKVAILQAHTTALASQSACERVASFLSRSRRKSAAAGPGLRLSLPMSRGEMGDHLNLTIETTSRCMTRLKNEGLIACPSRHEVVILDEVRLANFTD